MSAAGCLLITTLLSIFVGQLCAQEVRNDAKSAIHEIHFSGHDQLARANQSKFDDLELKDLAGLSAVEDLQERVQYLYQCNGYYKAEVKAYPHSLIGNSDEQPTSVDVQIVQNLQYRLRRLEFTGQKVFSAEQLRPLFPMQSGELFNLESIRQGLDNLRNAYEEHGYIEVTPVPEIKPDDSQALIDLSINLDEGPQFRIGTIAFSGAGSGDSSFQERVLKTLPLKPGDVYDSRLLEAFFSKNHSWLPGSSNVDDHLEMAHNAREHTVDLYFVFK